MKKLYLLRHAQASNPQGMDDRDRPLLEAGRQECKKMNSYLQENNIKPEVVLCSDAVRTMQTANFVIPRVFSTEKTEDDVIQITPNKKLYLATPGEIIKEISKIDDEVNSIMVVAHNPGIQQLAVILAGSGNAEFINEIRIGYPTCALTEFSFDINNWKKIEPRSGVLESFVV